MSGNRYVSIEKGTWSQVQSIDIPQEGMKVFLRNFGEVKLFRMLLKDQLRHYIVFLPKTDTYDTFQQADFQKIHSQHWKIEQYHRLIKQVCNIEKFQVRGKVPILNHIFAALCAYIYLKQMYFVDIINNAYQWQRKLYSDVIASFIKNFIPGKEYLNPQFQAVVNA